MKLTTRFWTAMALLAFSGAVGCQALQSRFGSMRSLPRPSMLMPRTQYDQPPMSPPVEVQPSNPVFLPAPNPPASEPLRLPVQAPPAVEDEEDAIPSAGLSPIKPMGFFTSSCNSCSPCMSACSPCVTSCSPCCKPSLLSKLQDSMSGMQCRMQATQARLGCMALKVKSCMPSLSCSSCCSTCAPCGSPCSSGCEPTYVMSAPACQSCPSMAPGYPVGMWQPAAYPQPVVWGPPMPTYGYPTGQWQPAMMSGQPGCSTCQQQPVSVWRPQAQPHYAAPQPVQQSWPQSPVGQPLQPGYSTPVVPSPAAN